MAAATVSTASVPVTTVEHPLRNPNYRLWLIGGTISFLGDQFYFVALPWLVLLQTGSAVAMGTIMMATATARTVLVTAIGVLVWLHVLQTWELYVLAFSFGVADAFAAPAAS